MNKAVLISKMTEKTGLSRKQSEEALDAFLDTISETLKNGDKVQIVGFGTFNLRHRDAHKGRNPATGETITVAASSTPCFKPGKSYKELF